MMATTTIQATIIAALAPKDKPVMAPLPWSDGKGGVVWIGAPDVGFVGVPFVEDDAVPPPDAGVVGAMTKKSATKWSVIWGTSVSCDSSRGTQL